MLDNITKKNIDNCRDVLVGKVPDPKSQIEQITLALIYKFMDDMDKESIDLGGLPKFFTGDYEKFGWRKLFNPSLGGKEVLDLYSEALDVLQTNANLPELFRNIFKNAYLPYRDPSTLKMFLKYINEFEYSHSEKLGDAFEYLLSVMGSQGDAGQFRTPRHVIDFIAACLNPQKHETVADPACGTAGFLLSAYKHILQNNTDKRLGDKLTPDDRKKLAENFYGYDISPDMVRLSLVNMYLHGFTTPKIFEYDTLSSEDRWNETFDVIAANPPFMTPKGGIRPHKKFGVQANKAEVLFTDYIAEHLTKNGRAGIVVPNGIVATTQTAYKQLRKMLVDESLIAVVSLPAGCFNPYSGVKTSILMLDKPLAKKTNHVLFIKVSNDGYDLGAQRREHDKNDLPLALEAFNVYKESISSGKPFNLEKYSSICALVEKDKIIKNKDFILNMDRYSISKLEVTDFQLKPISEFVEFTQTGLVRNKGEQNENFKYPYLKMDGITYEGQLNLNKTVNVNATLEEFEKYSLQKGDFLYNTRNTPDLVGKSTVFNGEENKYLFNNNILRVRFNSQLNPYYLNQVVNTSQYKEELKQFVDGTTSVAAIYPKNYFALEIPLPPIEIQEQIVKEIEGYQKIIDGAKMVLDNYKPTISIKPEWEMVELEQICKIQSGGTPSRTVKEYWENGTIAWVGSTVCKDREVESAEQYITDLGFKKSNTKLFPIGTTLIALVGATIGKTAYLKFETTTNQNIAGLFPLEENALNKRYLYFACQTLYNEFYKIGDGGFSMASLGFIKKLKIPMPTIDEQIEIVNIIENEQQLVSANKQLISIFEQKIKDKINEVWGVKEEVSYE